MKLLEAIFGYKIHYGFPEEDHKQKIIEDAVKFDKSGKMEMYDSKLGYWKRRAYKRRFYPYYQVLVRRQIQGEELRFLERRWTVYWTHINNLASITIAFASVWSFKSAGSQTNSNVHLLAGYFIIALALYFIAAMFQIRRLKHENKETEHLFLLNPKP